MNDERNQTPSADRAALLAVTTLVLWASCLAVGLAGLRWRYPWPMRAAAEPAAAEAISVQVTEDRSAPSSDAGAPPAPSHSAEPPPPPAIPPPPMTMVAPDAAPPMAAVATPNPAIAFAVPVDGPSRVVEARQAIPATRAAAPGASGAPAVATPAPGPPQANAPAAPGAARQLTFGQGEGKQPAPQYPREAVIARQQGTVVVRFTVGTNGRVTAAEVATPAASALLNQAALRAVRETWRFDTGPARIYEVTIQFELKSR